MTADGRADFDPKEIARAAFPTAFRGYDQDAVRRYLTRLATAIGRAQSVGLLGSVDAEKASSSREAELELEASELQLRVEELETLLEARPDPSELDAAPAVSRDLDEAELIELLGQETARVLEQARSAGAGIVKRAETEASLITEQAEAEAKTTLEAAESTLASTEAEAEQSREAITAATRRSQARNKAEIKQARELAQTKAGEILAEAARKAAKDLAAAQARANEAVVDAEQMREEVLGDLVRRHQLYEQQLDRMSSARDRLGHALAIARTELETVSSEIDLAGAASSGIKTSDQVAGEVELASAERLVGQLAMTSPAAIERVDSDPAAFVDHLLASRSESVAESIVAASDRGQDPDLELDMDGIHFEGGDFNEEIDELVDLDDVDLDDDDSAAAELDFDIEDTIDAGHADDTDDTEAEDTNGEGVGAGDDAMPVEYLQVERDRQPLPDEEPGFSITGLSEPSTTTPNGAGGGILSAETDVSLDHRDRRPDFDLDRSERSHLDLDFGGIPPAAPSTSTLHRAARGDLPRTVPYGGKLPAAFEGRDVALTRATPGFRRRLKRAINDDQSLVLDQLRAGRGTIRVEELPDYDEQLDGYLIALKPSLFEVVRAGSELGNYFEVDQESIDTLCLQLGRHIIDSLRRPTIAAIESAVDNDREAILDPVRATYRDFRNSLLPGLIDDALHEAFASGLFAAIEDDEYVLWLTDPRLDPDPICEDNSAAPPLLRGTGFPSGHIRPLSMPGCRCLAIPTP
ncbi:MAG: DivIVA domain-containing protein [Actinomycetia bacterium]|nr:DivIVA domain-containing protein [Actinomycetes bacterium]